eukprot:CAMPEP_0118940150 /NCGR_PEP_ID=MMETSP1169-20130426/30712_1 /TAXON_ID=36882 /ORGANISM="Pyramimonas obovata, Strain CCMP722" /LENGTH=268 /DNA_ID=CAMNT_0006884565 /DNA_START=159 /DNA_END=965 /DNA_ORIENTATION=+
MTLAQSLPADISSTGIASPSPKVLDLKKLSAPIPLPKIDSLKAILFDIDGTLTNSDPLHFEVFKELFLELGVNGGQPIDDAFFHRHISGRHNPSIFKEFFPDWDEERMNRVIDEKEEKFRQMAATVLTPLAGLPTLTAWIKQEGLKVAAVTNAPRANAELMLRALELDKYFDLLIIGEECARPKPYPDPYQAALDHFNLPPTQAIVFEDSLTGMQAALAAEVATIGVLTSQSATAMQDGGASATIADYTSEVLWEYLTPAGAKLHPEE